MQPFSYNGHTPLCDSLGMLERLRECEHDNIAAEQVPALIAGPFGRLGRYMLVADQAHRTVVQPPVQPRHRRHGGIREPSAPLPARQTGAGTVASREGVQQLTAMGFSEAEARSALEQCDNNVQAAASSLL